MLPADTTLEIRTSDKTPADKAPAGKALIGAGKAPGPVAGVFRRLTMAAVAGAVALSVMMGAPAPARADSTSDNVLKGLIALGAVGVLINSLDKNDHRDRRPQYDNRRPPPAAWRNNRHDNGWHKGHSKFQRDRDYRRNAWYNDRYDNRRDRRWSGPSHDR